MDGRSWDILERKILDRDGFLGLRDNHLGSSVDRKLDSVGLSTVSFLCFDYSCSIVWWPWPSYFHCSSSAFDDAFECLL